MMVSCRKIHIIIIIYNLLLSYSIHIQKSGFAVTILSPKNLTIIDTITAIIIDLIQNNNTENFICLRDFSCWLRRIRQV